MFAVSSLFSRLRPAAPSAVPVAVPRPFLPETAPPLERLAELLERAGSIVVLTGAGLSSGSGLSTYRGQDGRWNTEVPIRFREFLVDEAARLEQWRRSLGWARSFARVAPNAGHEAIARLATRPDTMVVTQNVDGLHRRSGMDPDRLIELHGQGDEAVCTHCRHRTPMMAHADTVASGVSPTCERDGGLLKPAVVLFGERPGQRVLAAAEGFARACDLFLVVGSSLAVTPAAFLPVDARNSGARVAILNRGRLHRDVGEHLRVEGDAAVLLPMLVPA